MLLQFSHYPLDSIHLSRDLAEVVQILHRSGLKYQLGPMSTCVEGDWEPALAAIRQCHQALAARHARVITTITIDDRRAGAHSLAEMVSAVESHVPHRHDAEVEC